MSWSYNQIDIYFLLEEMPLGIESVDLEDDEIEWFAASTYGIVRGRPSLTLSQMQGSTGTTIPGRNGIIYPSYASRGNAKLQFDILVENSWVHNPDDDGTVQERVDMLMALIRDAKTISYKMPGCPADFYLLTTKKADCTITNVDKDCIVIQATIEIIPFKYWFKGNKANVITSAEWLNYYNDYPNGIAKPVLVFKSTGAGTLTVSTDGDSTVISGTDMELYTVLDTNRCLAYVDNGEGRVNMNSHFTGDYTKLWIPRSGEIIIASTFNGSIDFYSKEGVDL